MADVTQVLSRIEQGDPSAAEKLLPLIYNELRRLAAAKMAEERGDNTLQATALVHEAYIRLVDQEKAQRWESRGHFFSAASEAMRRILVESARRKQGPTRGGKLRRQDADLDRLAEPETSDEVLAIDEALHKLSRQETQNRQARRIEILRRSDPERGCCNNRCFLPNRPSLLGLRKGSAASRDSPERCGMTQSDPRRSRFFSFFSFFHFPWPLFRRTLALLVEQPLQHLFLEAPRRERLRDFLGSMRAP